MLKTSNDQRKLLPKFDQLFATTAQAPGGVARLRELILTLAVQGKLVPQDANDEPASELLKKIRAEKDRLIAVGKIKRDKPLAAITEQEKPFEMPVGWEWTPLGEVIDVIRGITFPANEKTREPAEGRIACLRTANIQQEVEWHDMLYVSNDFISREEQELKDADIVMSMANSRELVGKVALVRGIPTGLATFGGFLSVLRPYFLAPVYVMNVLRTSYARSILIDSASQTTNIANISLAKLRPLAFPLPPLAEQSRIVTRVEELMRLCDALEEKGRLEHTQHQQLLQAMLDSLTQTQSAQELARHWQRLAQHFDLLIDRPEAVDALEQTILQLAVRGLLVEQEPSDEPASELLKKIRTEKDRLIAEGVIKSDKPLPAISDEEKPFELPVGWYFCRINDLADVQGGIQKTQLRKPIKNHFPYLRVANVQRDRLVLNEIERFELSSEELDRWSLKAGDLLIVEGNGSADEIGRCAVWDASIDPCVYQNHLIRVRCFKDDGMAFTKLFLNSPSGAEEMKKLAITTSGLYNLSVGKIRNYAVAVPPLAEQSRIVARVTELRTLCQQLRDKLTQARHTQTQLAQTWVEQAAT